MLALVAAAGALALGVGSDAGASTKSVVVTGATVTAAKKGGPSAVVVTIVNKTSNPITLLRVTSPVAAQHMIGYDTNMCQGNHAMIQLTNILITSGHTQALGYKYQGAMLWGLHSALTKGESIPLTLTWSNFQKLESVTVEALVVKPPAHINFGMSGMQM